MERIGRNRREQNLQRHKINDGWNGKEISKYEYGIKM